MNENKLIVDKDRQKIRHLLIVKDRKGKRVVPLSLAVYSFGRSQDNSIVLYSSSVSRYHATILPIADYDDKLAPFKIIDGNLQGIKSTNGLFVNGLKCDRHNLKHGDFIEFGNNVKVTYYTLFNLSDSEFAQFCDIQNNSDISEPLFKSRVDTINSSQVAKFTDANPINSASFFQLIPHPLIEIDLSGSITYYNFSAIKHFPELLTLKQNHPAIKDLPRLIQQQVSSHFVRQIKLQNKLFKQSIQYSLEEAIIQVLIIEITPEKEATIIPRYSDRLLQEVVASNLSFEKKINSLLKIGCDCFELDIGFLAKLQKNSLTIAAINKQADNYCFLEQDQILQITPDSSQQSLKLFQATIKADKPITLQQFDREKNCHIPSSATEFMPIAAYLGTSLNVGKKLYGILVFYSSVSRSNEFNQAQIDFLIILKQCLVREIERQKIELVLERVLQQKNYYQQIAEDMIDPIDEVKAIAQKLINTIDAQESKTVKNNPDDQSWLSLIEKLGDV